MSKVILHQGDCRKVLNRKVSVDTVITDPVWPNCPKGLLRGWRNPEALLTAALQHIECKRLIIIIRSDSDPRILRAVPSRYPFFKLQILRYVMPGYIGRKLGGDEVAYCFGSPLTSKPGRRVYGTYSPAVQPGARKRTGHPCGRTLPHMRWLVQWWTEPGETILDPFMGGGSTGIAAVQMNRNFIGIEIDKRWFKLAKAQIEEAQDTLFDFPDKKPIDVQLQLYKY